MAGLAASVPTVASAAVRSVEISFYFPVAVGGTVAALISRLVDDFEREHPEIRVRPIYAGTYQEAIAKVAHRPQGGTPPDLAVLFAADMYTLIDADAIVPFDDVSAAARLDPAWMEGFFPALMANSRAAGKTWGIPFQRSTLLLYWNKAHFRETGLDPDRPPANWQEMQGFAQRLTRRENSTAPPPAGACRSRPRAFRTGCSRASPPPTAPADERQRHADAVQPARRGGGAAVLARPGAAAQGASARGSGLGLDAARLSRPEGLDDLDHQRQPRRPQGRRRLRLRRGQAAGEDHGAARPPAAATSICSPSARRRSARPRSSSPAGW